MIPKFAFSSTHSLKLMYIPSDKPTNTLWIKCCGRPLVSQHLGSLGTALGYELGGTHHPQPILERHELEHCHNEHTCVAHLGKARVGLPQCHVISEPHPKASHNRRDSPGTTSRKRETFRSSFPKDKVSNQRQQRDRRGRQRHHVLGAFEFGVNRGSRDRHDPD